jgi:hypothetical protein
MKFYNEINAIVKKNIEDLIQHIIEIDHEFVIDFLKKSNKRVNNVVKVVENIDLKYGQIHDGLSIFVLVVI